MEGTKRRAANSLGMFDLLKGVGMLTIVFAHTGELYPMGDASHINPLTFCMFAYRESLMAAFYIASGYGFRKRSIGKCIDQQFKTLFKPYIYTGIATIDEARQLFARRLDGEHRARLGTITNEEALLKIANAIAIAIGI